MKFLTYSNSFSVTTTRNAEDFVGEAMVLLWEKLRNEKAYNLRRQGDTIKFSGGIFRSVWTSWNLLNGITNGYIEFTRDGRKIWVQYNINFTELFVISLFFTTVIFFMTDRSLLIRVSLFLLYNTLFFGVNAGLSLLQYNRFMKASIATVLENDPPVISREQQTWITDESKCDACGHEIFSTDKTCPDCGITLQVIQKNNLET